MLVLYNLKWAIWLIKHQTLNLKFQGLNKSLAKDLSTGQSTYVVPHKYCNIECFVSSLPSINWNQIKWMVTWYPIVTTDWSVRNNLRATFVVPRQYTCTSQKPPPQLTPFNGRLRKKAKETELPSHTWSHFSRPWLSHTGKVLVVGVHCKFLYFICSVDK